jgi:pyruvate kinase
MHGFARGDVVVIVAGAPPHTVGVTDLLRVRRLGDDLDRSPTGMA